MTAVVFSLAVATSRLHCVRACWCLCLRGACMPGMVLILLALGVIAMLLLR